MPATKKQHHFFEDMSHGHISEIRNFFNTNKTNLIINGTALLSEIKMNVSDFEDFRPSEFEVLIKKIKPLEQNAHSFRVERGEKYNTKKQALRTKEIACIFYEPDDPSFLENLLIYTKNTKIWITDSVIYSVDIHAGSCWFTSVRKSKRNKRH